MAKYVALLRGINVGGAHKVPMADLRRVFEQLGHRDVTTYIQSGNVVFDDGTGDPVRLVESLEAAIADEFGFEVPVVARPAAEVEIAVDANPYAGRADPSRVAIAFLSEAPSEELVASLDAVTEPPDELTALGRELHMLCPDGLGRSALAQAVSALRAAPVATTRNLRTARKLLALAAS